MDCSFKFLSAWKRLITVYGGGVELHLSPSFSLFLSPRVWRLPISVYLFWGQWANIDRVDLNERRFHFCCRVSEMSFPHQWQEVVHRSGLVGGGWRIFRQRREAAGASHQHEPFSFIYFPSTLVPLAAATINSAGSEPSIPALQAFTTTLLIVQPVAESWNTGSRHTVASNTMIHSILTIILSGRTLTIKAALPSPLQTLFLHHYCSSTITSN